jgi:hypothetical protein
MYLQLVDFSISVGHEGQTRIVFGIPGRGVSIT